MDLFGLFICSVAFGLICLLIALLDFAFGIVATQRRSPVASYSPATPDEVASFIGSIN